MVTSRGTMTNSFSWGPQVSITIFAASGSAAMLNSVEELLLPNAIAPPIKQRPLRCSQISSPWALRRRAALVRGPVHNSQHVPLGVAMIPLYMAEIAEPCLAMAGSCSGK